MQPMQIVCQENLNEKLFALYEQLRLQHGALMWWPADTPFEVALGGILTQATSWRNEAGFSRFARLAGLRVKSRYRQRRYRVTQIAFLSPTNLSERFAPGQKAAGAWTPAQLLATSQTELEELLRPSRYYRAKAKKVRAFVEHLAKRPMHVMFEQALPELRQELLSIYGIGPETADTIILYAAEKPSFVVDAYTHRLFSRLGWIKGNFHYAKLRNLFMENLPHDFLSWRKANG